MKRVDASNLRVMPIRIKLDLGDVDDVSHKGVGVYDPGHCIWTGSSFE